MKKISKMSVMKVRLVSRGRTNADEAELSPSTTLVSNASPEALPKDPKEYKDFKDLKDLKGLKSLQDFKDFKEIKEIKEVKEIKELKELKDFRDFRDLKDHRDPREHRDSIEFPPVELKLDLPTKDQFSALSFASREQSFALSFQMNRSLTRTENFASNFFGIFPVAPKLETGIDFTKGDYKLDNDESTGKCESFSLQPSQLHSFSIGNSLCGRNVPELGFVKSQEPRDPKEFKEPKSLGGPLESPELPPSDLPFFKKNFVKSKISEEGKLALSSALLSEPNMLS